MGVSRFDGYVGWWVGLNTLYTALLDRVSDDIAEETVTTLMVVGAGAFVRWMCACVFWLSLHAHISVAAPDWDILRHNRQGSGVCVFGFVDWRVYACSDGQGA